MTIALRWMIVCTLAAWLGAAALAQEPVPATAPAPELTEVQKASLVPSPDPIADEQGRIAEAALVGTWTNDEGAGRVQVTFTRDGRYTLGNERGSYSIQGNKLRLVNARGTTVYEFDLTTDQLTIRGGRLTKETKFTKQADIFQYMQGVFEFSPASLKRRALRILTIIGIVIAAGLILSFIRQVLSFMVLHDYGPLRWVWRYRKNRAMTMHSLVVNLIKYVIYFTAFGFILSELGINYTTYIASLSVVGLAIGFGSQGLVQDMVTGMFIIFEEQFDVGDMVEISGQVGLVTELGLRMTKLRNYLGQTVYIPNRNIAVVGTFNKGAQQAQIDVQIDPQQVEEAKRVLDDVADEVARQFPGVMINEDPEVTGPITLATGEVFLRVHVAIWPQQTWVVDAQLVPRIREVFKTNNLAIPNDRIAVSYHAREQQRLLTWRDAIQNIRNRFDFDRVRSRKVDKEDEGSVEI